MSPKQWVVQLATDPSNGPFYIATWEGDPGRTYSQAHAQRYDSRGDADRGLTAARKWRPFPRAEIIEVQP